MIIIFFSATLTCSRLTCIGIALTKMFYSVCLSCVNHSHIFKCNFHWTNNLFCTLINLLCKALFTFRTFSFVRIPLVRRFTSTLPSIKFIRMITWRTSLFAMLRTVCVDCMNAISAVAFFYFTSFYYLWWCVHRKLGIKSSIAFRTLRLIMLYAKLCCCCSVRATTNFFYASKRFIEVIIIGLYGELFSPTIFRPMRIYQWWSCARLVVHTHIHAHGTCAMCVCAHEKDTKSCAKSYKIANFAAHDDTCTQHMCLVRVRTWKDTHMTITGIYACLHTDRFHTVRSHPCI